MNKTTERLFDIVEQMSEEKRLALLEKLEEKPSNNRERGRKSLHLAIVDYSADGYFYKDFLRDISFGGAFIETKAIFTIGTEVCITLPILEKDQPLKIVGTIVRLSPEGVGVKFKNSMKMEGLLNHL